MAKTKGKAEVRRDCPKCGKKNQVFYGASGSYCKNCSREYQRVQHHVKKWKPFLLKRQKRKCAICRRNLAKVPPQQQHVDHIHGTGFVRGLLCKSCNNMLGNAKDNPDILRQAADYLDERGEGENPEAWMDDD